MYKAPQDHWKVNFVAYCNLFLEGKNEVVKMVNGEW